MSFNESLSRCIFEKYATFKGTASRSEYWWFWAMYNFILIGLPVVAFLFGESRGIDNSGIGIGEYILMAVWFIGSIGLLCPFVAVSIRRLHDGGYSGWNFLWRFLIIGGVGWIITIVLMTQPSRKTKSEANDAIPAPKQGLTFSTIDVRSDTSVDHSRFMPRVGETNNVEQEIADIEENPSIHADNITIQTKVCYCKHCGKKVENADAQFCKHCGNPL